MSSKRYSFGSASIALVAWSLVCVNAVHAELPITYGRHIQPIFAEHCLQCHGPDAEKREADLRLDVEASAKELAIAVGSPADSTLIDRITSNDPDLRMPPSDAPPLNRTQIDLLRRWIGNGAPYERHWAYRPIEPVEVPDAAGDWSSDVDRLVVARLHENGLRLSKPATKQQLIRRATFDLTGLPPTWKEVEEFSNDSSPQAFEKVVDRLLATDAYGERWGRHWLDIARYADTHGGAAIGFKRFAFSYTYRDYVINAFNQDLPYNQFVTEQLAADQLGLADNATQLAALGFLTVGMQFRNPHNQFDDQIDVVTRGLMGLTVSCARCHDHKFDSITTEDYYSLYAVFASSETPAQLPIIGTPADSETLRQYEENLSRLEISYHDMAREQSEVMRNRLRMQVGLYLREIANDAPEPDLVSADVLSYRTDDLRPIVLFRWQQYLHNMPETDAVFGPWVQLYEIHATKRERKAESESAVLPNDTEFAKACDALLAKLKNENGESKDLHRLAAEAPRWNPRVLNVLTAKHPKTMLDVADAYGELFGEVHREWLQALQGMSLEAKPGNTPVPDEHEKHLVANSPVNRQLRRHLYGPDAPIAVPDRTASRLLNRPINDNVSGRRAAIHNLNLSSPGSPARAKSLVERMDAGAFQVLLRGNPRQRGANVSARFLSALGGKDQESFPPGKRRLELANAIVSPANPLTRRVVVKRVWQHHFGKGLVATPDDFGTRGEPPTHHGLLDYLAARFLEDGWSLKKLHRLVMLSSVYQQASIEHSAARLVDPDNALLWRMPRRRLEMESMRDAMLFASGELSDQRGGRPFELQSKPIVPRRTVYAFVNRDIVNPLMSTFDAANPNACTAKRPRTTVPQQTLFALNSDFVQDRAAVLAKRVLEALPNEIEESDAYCVRELYRRSLSRDPDKMELKTAIRFVNSLRADKDDQDDPVKPWRMLAHALLASNEFFYLD